MEKARPRQVAAEKAGITDRFRRLRPGIMSALLCLLTLPWILYAGFSLDTAVRMRTRSVLDRNQTLAQLAARLLDEQSNAALRTLRQLTEREALRDSLRHGAWSAVARAAVRGHLRQAVDLVPDLLFVAAYRPDGTPVTSYSRVPVASGRALAPPRFKPVYAGAAPYITRVTRLRDRDRTLVLSLAVPVPRGSSRRARAKREETSYLLAYYRLRGVDDWARRQPVGADSDLYVLDSASREVTGSRKGYAPKVWTNFSPLQRARKNAVGAEEVRTPWNGQKALVGYAFAGIPRWSVLVVQPRASALAPANYLLVRLFALLLPVLALVGVAAVAMSRLYRNREEMADLLARQNDDLRSLGSVRSEFLANVSHDLGTPLTNIQVALSGLMDPSIPWEKAQVHDCLTIANEEVEVLKTRVRNLLEMSRIDAKAYTFRKEPCDLADVVSAVLERLEPLMRSRPFTVDFPAEPLVVEGDQGQLETVLRNLLENAIKYSPLGTPIHLQGMNRAGNALLYVRDRGPGIPPGDEARIFMKFYRARGKISGTGLGLAICQAIISEHRGIISARNMPGGGAEFCVLLPLLTPKAAEERPPAVGALR